MTNMVGAPSQQAIPEETVTAWSQLFAQVRADETLRQRLVNTPAAVLQEHGIDVPAGMEIRVVENTDKVSYITLPAKGAQGELTGDELAQVSGGNPFLAGLLIGTALGGGAAIATIVAKNTGTLKGLKRPEKPK